MKHVETTLATTNDTERINYFATVFSVIASFAHNREGHLTIANYPNCIIDDIFFDKEQKLLMLSQFCIAPSSAEISLYSKTIFDVRQILNTSIDIQDNGDVNIVLDGFYAESPVTVSLTFRRHRRLN